MLQELALYGWTSVTSETHIEPKRPSEVYDFETSMISEEAASLSTLASHYLHSASALCNSIKVSQPIEILVRCL